MHGSSRILAWKVVAAILAALPGIVPEQAAAQACDCFLNVCDAGGNVTSTFSSPHSLSVRTGEDDTVANEIVIDRDYDFRVGLVVASADVERVKQAQGIDVELDTLGDGQVALQVSFGHFQRTSFHAGDCAGLNTRSYKQVFALFLADGREASGSPNPFGLAPLQTMLPAGWADAPVRTDPFTNYQPNSKITIEIKDEAESQHRVLKYKAELASADRQTALRFNFEYDGDLPFQENSADLKWLNVPIHVGNVVIYCNNYREVALIPVTEPNLRVDVVMQTQRLCFPDLFDAAGMPVCVTPLRDAAGRVQVTDVRVYRYSGLECEAYDGSASPGIQRTPVPEVPANFIPG